MRGQSGGTSGTGSGSDNFARANGGLGPNWTAMSDGAMAIANQQVVGTNGSGNSGDIRTAETYTSDQTSQIQLTATQLTGNQWIGPAVRAQSGNGSTNMYVGFYSWNGGSPKLMMFKRINGSWGQLGQVSCSPLPAGTQLILTAVGNPVALSENGVLQLSATDTSLTGGAPGIMANGTAAADNWSATTLDFRSNTPAPTPPACRPMRPSLRTTVMARQVLRVLQPTHPAAGVAHNFLYVLPVEAGLGTANGDGLKTLQALDAEDQYNLTIIEPSFAIEPWYANVPTDPNLQYETFMTNELVPWVKANLSTTGTEQNWLIGYSKSGYGGQDLILKHPDLFTLAATWDFPADMSSYTQYGTSTQGYGTQANFAANYELTSAFVAAHKAPFVSVNRIWIGGYSLYGTDISDYDALLTSQGIVHTLGPSQYLAHRWDSGWMPAAVAALYQDSLHVPPSS